MVRLMPTRRQWTKAMHSLQSASQHAALHLVKTTGEENNSADLTAAFKNLEQAALELGFDLVPRDAANDMSART